MKAIHWIIAAVALSFVQPTQAAQSDPEVIIYRFPGVLDNGGASNTGLATSFHCTNFSGAAENIRFVTRAASARFSPTWFSVSSTLGLSRYQHTRPIFTLTLEQF